MQVDLASVVSLISGLVSIAFGLYVAIARYAISQREREIDRRMDELKKTQETYASEATKDAKERIERLNTEEKATIRQDGQIKLIEQICADLGHAVDEIKRVHVTKNELEPRMNNLERSIHQLLAELRGSRYSSHSGLSATQRPSTPPPPKK